jgi:hypothetical protein
VSRQRVQQLAAASRLPASVGEDRIGQVLATERHAALVQDVGTRTPVAETSSGHASTLVRLAAIEDYRDADRRRPLDPLHPKASHHAPECEFASRPSPLASGRFESQGRQGLGYWWVRATRATPPDRLPTSPGNGSGDDDRCWADRGPNHRDESRGRPLRLRLADPSASTRTSSRERSTRSGARFERR